MDERANQFVTDNDNLRVYDEDAEPSAPSISAEGDPEEKVNINVEIATSEENPIHIADECCPNSWWSLSITIGDLILLLGLIFSVITYIKNQRSNRSQKQQEIDWKRIETMLNQSKVFEEDDDIQSVVQILTGNNRKNKPSQYLRDTPIIDEDEDNYTIFWRGFDKMLNFLERLAYAYHSKTLTSDDLQIFRWYILRVTSPELEYSRSYVQKHYTNLFKLAEDLRRKE